MGAELERLLEEGAVAMQMGAQGAYGFTRSFCDFWAGLPFQQTWEWIILFARLFERLLVRAVTPCKSQPSNKVYIPDMSLRTGSTPVSSVSSGSCFHLFGQMMLFVHQQRE